MAIFTPKYLHTFSVTQKYNKFNILQFDRFICTLSEWLWKSQKELRHKQTDQRSMNLKQNSVLCLSIYRLGFVCLLIWLMFSKLFENISLYKEPKRISKTFLHVHADNGLIKKIIYYHYKWHMWSLLKWPNIPSGWKLKTACTHVLRRSERPSLLWRGRTWDMIPLESSKGTEKQIQNKNKG